MKLETLNIRNMPIIDRLGSYMSPEAMFRSLATATVELCVDYITHESGNRPSLKTIALGALTYRDRYLGGCPHEPIDQYLQLRTYHIDYVDNDRKKSTPLLTLSSKGYVHTNEDAENASILQPYWLA